MPYNTLSHTANSHTASYITGRWFACVEDTDGMDFVDVEDITEDLIDG